MAKIILITGASSGIGLATAEKFARAGYDIIALAIEPALTALAQTMEKKFKARVLPLVLDVRDWRAVRAAVAGLPKAWRKIDVLVNGAGVALGRCALQDGLTEDWDRMIDVNLKGLLYVFKAIVPGMLKQKNGHIINIGSITGKEIYPAGGAYSVTKHAVNALTGSIRLDLVNSGIKVTVINPGRVATNLEMVRYKGDKQRAAQDYQEFIPLRPADVADAIFYAATLPKHVNIHEMTITPAAMASASIFCKQK